MYKFIPDKWCDRAKFKIDLSMLTFTHSNMRYLTCRKILISVCNTLRHTATHCNTLQHTATHCNTLQHTATHRNPLQPNATCATLQHTPKHCVTAYSQVRSLLDSPHALELRHVSTRRGGVEGDDADENGKPPPFGIYIHPWHEYVK